MEEVKGCASVQQNGYSFRREDREALTTLWPPVQEARKKGKQAFLEEGNALIVNRCVDPD